MKLTLNDIMKDPVPYLVRPLMIEFFSQFIMTFWGVMTEAPYQAPAVIESLNDTIVEPVEKDYLMYTFGPAFQTGISVWAEILLFAKMSFAPAQFNPSISMVLCVVGTLPPILLVPNIIIQCIASVFAAFMSQAIRGAPPAALIIPDEASSASIFASEVILVAAVTIWAAEITQNPDYDEPMGPFGLGMSVFMAVLSSKWTGVVCLSPSRVFGPAVMVGGKAWNRHWLLWIADLIGSASAGVFWLLFLAPFNRAWIGRFVKGEQNPIPKSEILMDERKDNDMEA